jgi:cellulose synthase/poly-beta-1,6-N-acetylglucosamine synthase-like glycosyltransferase
LSASLRAAARRTATVASLGLTGLTALTTTLSGYLTLLTVVGARRPEPRTAAGVLRYAFLVPAHDEEAVIGAALSSFGALRAERERFDVHVVADNCTDRTASIVRESGWTVHERDDPTNAGKGPALNWLFDRVDATAEFDVVVVVDADTIVDPDFLSGLDAAFAHGARAVQGRYGVLAPESTPAVALRAAALAARHHLRPLGRTRLGASCGLYGNGMAFERELLRHRRWSGHLVEDHEFQLDLLADGILVAYAPGAKLEAEMPSTLDRSEAQHQRWELGRLQMLRRHAAGLARRTLVGGGAPGRIASADALLDLMVPPLSVLVLTQTIGTSMSAVTAVARGGRHQWVAAVGALGALGLVAHVLVALRSVGTPRSTYRALVSAPALIWWKVRNYASVLSRPEQVEWRRTGRNSEPLPGGAGRSS